MISKNAIMEYLDIDEEEYRELKGKGLLPDKSEKANKKFDELMEQGPPFDTDELMFLGKMDLMRFSDKYPAEACFYMDL